MQRSHFLFTLVLAGLIAGCAGEKNPLSATLDPLPQEHTQADIGISNGAENLVKQVQVGGSGRGHYAMDANAIQSTTLSPNLLPSAVYWPTGNRADTYGTLESYQNYTHQDAVTNVTFPRSYSGVPVMSTESIGAIENGIFRPDLTVMASGDPSTLFHITSFCAIGGTNGHPYYEDELFSAPHGLFQMIRDNNGSVAPGDATPSNPQFASNCGKTLYRLTLNVQGYAGDPITSGTETRGTSTAGWDVVLNDFPLYTLQTLNPTNDGFLQTFYVLSNSPVWFKPEFRTANPFGTWRVASASIHSLDRYDGSAGWTNEPTCTGTVFTEAFDLDQSIGSVDEGYIARIDTTVPGCVIQTNNPFTVDIAP